MDRRSAVRTLATTAALPVLAPEQLSALLGARRSLRHAAAGDLPPAALTEGELEIVGLVADIILPRSETPSATDVGVPAFVDLIVSEWMDEDEAQELRGGLADLDAVAAERFGRAFAECVGDQQMTLVRELDDRLPEAGTEAETPEGVYPTLKRLVLTGYFTTEAGAAQTGYRIIPGAFGGCVAPEAAR
jgi:gluconate 2-dehydrogenase gamma chain